MATNEEYVQHLDGRVSKLETNVASIATEVSSIKDSQALIVSKLDNLSSNQAAHGKVSWPLVVAIGMFLLTVFGLGITGTKLLLSPIYEAQGKAVKVEERLIEEAVAAVRRLDVYEHRLNHLEAELKHHENLNNHPSRAER